jgi:uncharacterized protein (DUF2147 family)
MNLGSSVLAPLLPVLAGLAETGPAPTGYWINPAASVIVEISLCGEDHLCGHVRWASSKAASDARANGTDPLAGTKLLHEFEPAGQGRWKGRLFVPDLRKTSPAELRLTGDGQLKIIGCVAGGIFCKSQLWRRIDLSAVPGS